MSNTDCMFTFIRSLFELTGVDHRISSLYHPQTNELDEQMNQTLVHALNKLTTEEGQWDQFIDAYRISIQDSSWFFPFVLLYNRQPRKVIDHEFVSATFPTVQRVQMTGFL